MATKLAAFRLTPETLEKIKKLAQSNSQTCTKVIENAISLYFVLCEAEKLKAIQGVIQQTKPQLPKKQQGVM